MFGHPRVEPSAAGRTCATVGPLGLEPKLPLRYARLYALIGGYFWHSGPKNMDRLFGLGPLGGGTAGTRFRYPTPRLAPRLRGCPGTERRGHRQPLLPLGAELLCAWH